MQLFNVFPQGVGFNIIAALDMTTRTALGISKRFTSQYKVISNLQTMAIPEGKSTIDNDYMAGKHKPGIVTINGVPIKLT